VTGEQPEVEAAAAPGRLTTFPDVVQRSDAWYDQRRGLITASVVGSLITPKTLGLADNSSSRGLVALLAAERLTGVTDLTYESYDMVRGMEDEPYAVAAYGEHHAPVTACGFMVRAWGRCRLGYSPDGLVAGEGLIEVKSRNQKLQVQAVVAGVVPAEHVAQCQAALFVSGRPWLDFVSFSAGMHLPPPVRVEPSPRWFAAIAAAVEAAEAEIELTTDAYLRAVEGRPLTERRADDDEVI
jgi:hypothetical protein